MPEKPDRWPAVTSWALGVLFLWTLAASAVQGGWSGFGAFWALYWKLALAVVGAVALYSAFRQGPVELLATLVVAATVVWIFYSDSVFRWPSALADLACAVAAWGLTILAMRWLTRRRDPGVTDWRKVAPESLAHLDAVVWGVLAWLLVSIVTVARERPLPIDPGRFARLAQGRWQELRIGLALSGGGYRAAVFHAGVLQALEELGIRVGNLTTVSGGSIVGSYYALGGDPVAFADAVAAGRFNMKRRLLLAHNLLRLPFPMRVPGLGVELLPLYRFDRLDAQLQLLERVLFGAADLPDDLVESAPNAGRPRLMIAVTDLTYGFQLGLLPDGMLKLGEGVGGWDVYRGAAFEASDRLTLAQRVAISGAFPIAFPPRQLTVRVRPLEATGTGPRELLLADGGIRDNTGYDLLRVADRLADADAAAEARSRADGVADFRLPADWNLDAFLVSDGGAVLGVLEERGGTLGLLSRAFEVASIESEGRRRANEGCTALADHPTVFSPALQFIPPDSQFNLKGDSERRAALPREWNVGFDPARYPPEVGRRLIDALPAEPRATASATYEAFVEAWQSHRTRDGRWSREVNRARDGDLCRPGASAVEPPLLPGTCEALALRDLVSRAVMADLDVFRTASTLDDTPRPETVDALERLGRMLVYLQWPQLEQHLDQAMACRFGPSRQSGEAGSAWREPKRRDLGALGEATRRARADAERARGSLR